MNDFIVRQQKRNPLTFGAMTTAALLSVGLATAAQSQGFVDVVTRDPSFNNEKGRLCFATNNKTDIGCPADAPYLDTATGKLGIGTSTPSTTLHVVGPATVTGLLSLSRPIIMMGSFGMPQTAILQMINGSGGHSGNWAITVPYGANSSAGSNYDFVIRHANAGVNVVNIDDLTMNVGIRTSNPSATLHVSGSIMASLNQSRFSISPWESGTDQGVDIGTSGSGFTRYAMQFFANGRRQMVITPSGTVIGNNLLSDNTAYAPLDINGTLKIASSGEPCDTNRLGAMRYVSGSFYVCGNVAKNWEPLSTSGVIDRIVSGTTQAIAYENTSLSLVTDGTERMVVGTNGSVGIGSPSPKAMLDVSGAIKISGDGTEGCSSAGDHGKIRINPTTGHLQTCKF
ncbi:hypothetical protein ACWGMK_00815 [Agrobacterium deltaense]